MKTSFVATHVRSAAKALAYEVNRYHDALHELQRLTMFLLENTTVDPKDIDNWLEKEKFGEDESGFWLEIPLCEKFRSGKAPEDAISHSWSAALKDDTGARERLYVLRGFGSHLKRIRKRLPGAIWIYYQDISNTSIQFPYIDPAGAITPDFDWKSYHTWLSVEPEANPKREIRWTPPSIDYAGAGLILSVSIPVYLDDKFTGVWSIDLAQDGLLKEYLEQPPASDMEMFIIDLAGNIVSHPKIKTRISPKKGSLFQEDKAVLGPDFEALDMEKIAEDDSGTLNLKQCPGSNVKCSFKHLPEIGWTVLATYSATALMDETFTEMEKALSKIKKGDLTYRIPEVGIMEQAKVLVEEYNQMAAALQEQAFLRGQIENALQESESKYKTLFEANPDGILIAEAETKKFLFANKAICAMLGYAQDELTNMTILDIHPQYAHKSVFNDFTSQMEGKKKVSENFPCLARDGSIVYVDIRAAGINMGGLQCSIGFIRDITERKLAQEKLSASEERFRKLLQEVPNIAIQGYKPDGTIFYWNKACEDIYGYSEEEALNNNLLKLIIPPEMRDEIRLNILKGAETRSMPPPEELSLMRKDGSRISVYCNHALVDHPGQEPDMYCLDVDLRERNQMMMDLRKARDEAERANKSKDEFLANISHELRTPLNGMFGMLQLVKQTNLDEEQRSYVETALASGKSLLTVINDILDFTMMEAGVMKITDDEFDLREAVGVVMDNFKFMACDKNINLRIDIDRNIPTPLVGDDGRIRQILFNLVGNSIKFTEKGEVCVQVRLQPDSSCDDCAKLLFSVSDTGIGIPSDQLESIFSPFTQVDGSYTRRYQGTGLGLGIVKKLISLMKGFISIESEVGRGTTLEFTLELRLSPAAKLRKQASGPTPRVPTPYHILVAEDDPINLTMITKVLEKMGHDAVAVKNGQQVLEALTGDRFDCILMDVQMPVLDGVETTTRIRNEDGGYGKIPIIAMTAHAYAGDKASFLDSGMDDYISKPIDINLLADVIERVICGSSGMQKA